MKKLFRLIISILLISPIIASAQVGQFIPFLRSTSATSTYATSTSNFFGLTITGSGLRIGASATSTINGTGDLLVVGSTTLQNFTGLKATTTQSTTTALAITGITSSLLKTASNGAVIPATNGTDFSLITALTCSGTDKISAVTAAGVFTCSTDQSGSGGGGVGFATTTVSNESIQFYGKGYVGIGTTTPNWLVQIASGTVPQLTLSDGTLTSNHWTLRSIGNYFYFATASPTTYATSSKSALTITSNGQLVVPFFDCSGKANGGVLTADSAGNITCTDDDSTAGGGTFPFTAQTYGVSTSTTVGFLAGLFSVGSTTIDGNLKITGNATATNATTTNFFSTTASSTNLFGTTGNLSALTVNDTLVARTFTLNAVPSVNADNIIIKKIGSVSASNIQYSFSHRSNNTDMWLYGYDGTTFKNFVGFTYDDHKVLFSPSGVGANLFVLDLNNKKAGIGTTTPQWAFQIATNTQPQLVLTDNSSNLYNHWTFRNSGNTFYLATASPSTYATSTSYAIRIDPNGFVRSKTDQPFIDEFQSSAYFSSSTLAYFSSATATIPLSNPRYAATTTSIYCKTDGGTSYDIIIGHNTASTSYMTCTTSGTELTSYPNGSFTARETVWIGIGNKQGTPRGITVTITQAKQ